MPDTLITAQDVINEFGSYYINQGQNMTSLIQRPFHAFGSREAFTNIPTNETQLRWSDIEVEEILQRYQDDYTPKGGVTFKPVKIDLHQVKIDQKFNPNALINTWLGFLTNNNTDRKTWPFIRWFIEYYILGKVDEDMETKVVYTGVQAAIVPGTAGATAGVINGAKKVINDLITAGDTTPIATGALSNDPVDFVTQVEDFVKQVPKKYWRNRMDLNMNPDREVLFVEGMQKKYNLNYAQVSDTMSVRNFANIKVKGRMSMDGSDKIWMTPIWNAVFPVKGFANAKAFEIESVDRSVKIWTDFWIGLGFLVGDLVFTNDVELA